MIVLNCNKPHTGTTLSARTAPVPAILHETNKGNPQPQLTMCAAPFTTELLVKACFRREIKMMALNNVPRKLCA